MDKHQPPLLLTSHPEVCDTHFLGIGSLNPEAPGTTGPSLCLQVAPASRDPLDRTACSQALFQLLLPRHSLRTGTSLSPNLLTHKGV